MKTESPAARLREFIVSRGMRSTPERYVVLEAIEKCSGPFSVDMVHEEIRGISPATIISRGTVVNTVRLLVEAGIVAPAGSRNRHLVYTLNPAGSDRRTSAGFQVKIYMECTACGRVKPSTDRAVIAPLLAKRYKSFHPTSCSVNIYGLCMSCRRKLETKLQTSKKK